MIMRLLTAVALTLALTLTAHAADKHRQLKPVDQGEIDASFATFRNELKAIVARKDAVALLKVLAPDIRNSFGDNQGIAGFKAMWNPTDAKSQLWPVFDLVVGLGGVFKKKTTFVTPYVFANFPDDLDAFENVVVTADKAVLRTAPRSDAPVLRALDHDILALAGSITKSQHEAGPADWLEIADASGKRGFVLQRDVRNPIDFRAYFEKRKGKWRMTILVAGD